MYKREMSDEHFRRILKALALHGKKDKMGKVRFIGNSGLQEEVGAAKEDGLEIGGLYDVKGGVVYGYSSFYKLTGFEGSYNTCMFEGDWQDHAHLLDHRY